MNNKQYKHEEVGWLVGWLVGWCLKALSTQVMFNE